MSEAGHLTAQIGNLVFNMDTLITMWIVMVVWIILALLITHNMKLIPNKLQAIGESIIGFFVELTDTIIGSEKGKKHIPILASLFLFIVVANLSGQLPWKLCHLSRGELASPTNDINMTAAMAIIVLVYYVFHGLKEKKWKFFIHEFSFVGIILFLVELLEMFTRPLTLALRLFGNILAGEILVTAIIGICALFCPLLVMFFELLVACVQALVFTMLTAVYISSAVNTEE